MSLPIAGKNCSCTWPTRGSRRLSFGGMDARSWNWKRMSTSKRSGRFWISANETRASLGDRKGDQAVAPQSQIIERLDRGWDRAGSRASEAFRLHPISHAVGPPIRLLQHMQETGCWNVVLGL